VDPKIDAAGGGLVVPVGVSLTARMRMRAVITHAGKLYSEVDVHGRVGEEKWWNESWLVGVPFKNEVLRGLGNKLVGWDVVDEPLLSEQFKLWLYVLPRDVQHYVLGLFGCLGLRKAKPGWARCLLQCVSKEALSYGPVTFGVYWRVLVGLDLNFGSSPLDTQGKADFKADVMSWVGPKVVTKEQEKVFTRGLNGIKREFLEKGKTAGHHNDADAFVAHPSAWLSNGASTLRGVEGTRANKYSMYLKHGDKIAAYLRGESELEDDARIQRVIEKRERKKLRGVINTSTSIYCLQAFVFQGANKLVNDTFRTPPTGGGRGVRFWQELIADAKLSYVLPLDYPKFDHLPCWLWIVRTLDSMAVSVIPKGKEGRQRRNAWVRCRELMRVSIIRVLGEDIPYVGGVLSGWYVTALLDTAINGILVAGMRLTYHLQQIAPPALKGDDVVLHPPSRTQAQRWLDVFMELLEITVAGFQTDGMRSEFLRYEYDKSIPGRRGYPSRAFAGVLWGNAYTSGGVILASELCSLFELLINRGMHRGRCTELLIMRLQSHFRASAKDCSDYLHTPACEGGRGWTPEAYRWVRLSRLEEVSAEGKRLSKFDDLLPGAVADIAATAQHLAVPMYGLDDMVAGLTLKNGKTSSDREFLAVVKRWTRLPTDQPVPWVRLANPRWSIDSLFMGGILRRGGREWEAFAYDGSELRRLVGVRRHMGDGWFRSWAMGSKVVNIPCDPDYSKFEMSAWEGDGQIGGRLVPLRNPRSSGSGRLGLHRAELALRCIGKRSILGD